MTEESTQNDDGQAGEVDLGQFKTAEDLLKSYKEIQGAFTRVSQENKTLAEQSAEMQSLKEELDSLKEQQQLASFQPPNQSRQRDFDESWMESPEDTINQRVAEQVNLARIEEVIQAEDLDNPAEFQERYAYVDALAKNPKYAPLARTAAGVKRLFKEADKLRKEQLKNNSRKALEHVFGETLDEEHLAKLKKVVFGDKSTSTKTNNDAYMPDGSTSTKSAADSEAVRNSDARVNAAVEKGDVDGVLDAIFDDIRA